jgi:putative sterol carrier protein
MSSTQQVDRLFKVLEAYFAHSSKPGAPLTKKIKAVFQIVITNDNSKYIIDLKNNSGSVRSGEESNADCTFSMKAEDFLALVAGKLNPQNAFMQGRLKIKGSIGVAMKFTPEVFPKLDQKLVADVSKSPQDIVNAVLGAAKL